MRIVHDHQPREVYNLAGQSHVKASFDVPGNTLETVTAGTLNLLEAIRTCCPTARFYQASTSEMFGNSPPPQNEQTAFSPQSPYACAKLAAHWLVVNYRKAYGLHACCGILFNHESPRRGETFVTRKITRAVARIKAGLQDKLYLGNLDACRDWGFAGDYVDAMWRMLQQDEPVDCVVATGESYAVWEFLELAFEYVGLDPWEHVVTDPRYLRPVEVGALRGDASEAERLLNWEPTVGFDDLVRMMVDADMEALGCR
jgi:GDPmannose 4,6-dehydratase